VRRSEYDAAWWLGTALRRLFEASGLRGQQVDYQKPYDPDAISRRVAALCGDGTDTAQRDQGRG